MKTNAKKLGGQGEEKGKKDGAQKDPGGGEALLGQGGGENFFFRPRYGGIEKPHRKKTKRRESETWEKAEILRKGGMVLSQRIRAWSERAKE